MSRKLTALLGLSLLASGLPTARAIGQPQQTVRVAISCSADGKLETIQVGGDPIETMDEQRYAEVIKRTLPDKRAAVTLNNNIGTPYRCIGAFIHNLQSLGYRRIGFIGEPPIARR